MNLQTRYITLDEYQEYFQEDLRELLGGDNQALAFLVRLEDRLEIYITSKCNRNIKFEYPAFSDYMKDCYKKALLEQAKYIIQNSDIAVDSGLDLERGEIISSHILSEKSLSPITKQYLTSCGLLNRNVNTHIPAYRRGWWF